MLQKNAIMIGIYKITSPSKKVYIGQSVNIEIRFAKYKGLHCKQQILLYNSLTKHGFDKHKFEILCECEVSELNEKERYYQDLYSAMGIKGLNCFLTKSSDKSGKLSEQIKTKIGNANRMRIVTSETRLKMSKKSIGNKSMSGKKHTDRTRQEMSERMKGNKNLLGSKMTNENKIKLIETNSKIILDTQTGIFFIGTKEASDAYGISRSVLTSKLIGRTKNKTNLIYV